MPEVLTKLAFALTILCPLGIGPLCFMLILSRWAERVRQSSQDKTYLNRRLAVSLLIWLPFTGFMLLRAFLSFMAGGGDDIAVGFLMTLGGLIGWLLFPAAYIGVGAWLVYLMRAPIYRRLP